MSIIYVTGNTFSSIHHLDSGIYKVDRWGMENKHKCYACHRSRAAGT